MGALRAAELHRFGMIGVGAVFSAYVAGLLSADDEVAVLHAPAELGYRPLTVAMVDVRAVLLEAVRARVATLAEARKLRDRARERFWRNRDWTTVENDVLALVAPSRARRLMDWLSLNRTSLKARDAALAIAFACRSEPCRVRPEPPPRTRFFMDLAAARAVRLSPGRLRDGS